MSREPRTITFEESALILGKVGLVLVRDGTDPECPWAVWPWTPSTSWMAESRGATVSEVLTNVFHNPVVVLDEVAELRAENERLRADLFEYVLDGFVQGAHRQEDGGYNTGGISTYRDLGNWLVEHAHWTRRPGGRGRNQVYDPPKADAASEGQP